MSVRIRLKRVGRRHRPAYRLAAMDGRQPRDSKVIEELGTYNPVHPREDEQITVKRDRLEYWLSVGARPTENVQRLLRRLDISASSKV